MPSTMSKLPPGKSKCSRPLLRSVSHVRLRMTDSHGQVLSELNSYLHKEDVFSKKNVFVATGVGNHQMMSCQFLRWIKLLGAL